MPVRATNRNIFQWNLNGLPQARTAAEDFKTEKSQDGPFDWEIPIQEYENIQNNIKERTFLTIAPLAGYWESQIP